MNQVNFANGMDIESFVNNITAEASKGQIEDHKVSAARVKVHTEKIQDKRQEQIENLMEQMKGASSGGCLKFLTAVFKVFDILLKPLSALTAGQLKLELGRSLEMLLKGKEQRNFLGLKINEGKISKVLDGLKQVLQEDMQRIEQREEMSHKETQKIIQMIEEIQQGLGTTVKS